MIPTSIDGTDITGATIDGQDVQEITVDGQTVFTADILPAGTVGFWNFNEGSGTTAADSVGNRDATLQSGVSFDSGTVTEGSHSIDFTATSNGATLPNTFGSLLTNDFTMVCFVYDQNQSSDFDRIWHFQAEKVIGLSHDDTSSYEFLNGDFNGPLISISSVPADEWFLMAGRIDYGASSSSLDIVLQDGTHLSATGGIGDSTFSTSQNGFGYLEDFNFPFTGYIDAATFVDRFMTTQELKDYADRVL